MEIERKYEIKYIPGDLIKYKSKKIEQGYLCNKPTLRIRKSNRSYYLTYKSKLKDSKQQDGAAIVRNEVELWLSKESYQVLKEKVNNNMVYKTRYLIPLTDNLIAELDIFEGALEGLIIVEVEFPDIKASEEFVPPDWFGKELSGDKRYSNHNLSKLSSYSELYHK